MKKLFLMLLAVLAFMPAGCNGTAEPEDESEEQTSQGESGNQNRTSGKDAQFVAATDSFMVTDPIIDKYLAEVTYEERNYDYTHVTDYEGGPGESDKPSVFTVSWEADPDAGEITVLLKDKTGWSRETSLAAGKTSADFTNLLPGTTYEYKVTGSNGRILAQGSFPTKGRIHLLNFPKDIRNVRDLGGWKTSSGETVAFRKLYRGGQITGGHLSSAGKKDMLAEGILAELDLRESKDAPSSSPLGKDIAFYCSSCSKAYGGLFREYPHKIKKGFSFIVKNLKEGKPVFFHCSLGRDRTGTMAALMLGLLGVSESDISKDFELIYFAPKDWSLADNKPAFEYSRTKAYAIRYACDELWKLGAGATFKESVENYLLNYYYNGDESVKVTQEEIDSFREIMLVK